MSGCNINCQEPCRSKCGDASENNLRANVNIAKKSPLATKDSVLALVMDVDAAAVVAVVDATVVALAVPRGVEVALAVVVATAVEGEYLIPPLCSGVSYKVNGSSDREVGWEWGE